MFTAKTLSFLRSLQKNNDREWFRARKPEYERHVRTPMLAVIERLADDFRAFAPELDVSPRCLHRIHRDTRFSEDKTPLKTHAAASFRWKTLPRGEAAGLYFEIAPGWVWMGGGFYAPEMFHLVRIRQHISDTYPELHQLTRAPAFRRAVGALEGERLTRVPRGHLRHDPAADYLKYRNYLAGREFPPELATSSRFTRPSFGRSGRSCR